MKKIVILVVFVSMLFAPHALATPLAGIWDLEDGFAAVLDPDGDGGNIGDEAAGRDTYIHSKPDNAYYWSFDELIRTQTILGEIIDNGDDTGSRTTEIYRTGGTFEIHGDNLWGQPQGTVYEVSINSVFNGVNYFKKVGDEWKWQEAIGSSHIWGKFKNDPFLFDLTDTTVMDDYGYNIIVGHNVYMGTMTDVVMTVSPVPEPSTMLLFGFALLGLAGVNKRRK